jgi:uncharacterized membrane protein
VAIGRVFLRGGHRSPSCSGRVRKDYPRLGAFCPQVIFYTGLCEIFGAAALLTRSLWYWAGIALALYAFCVWPANFKHAFDGIHVAQIPTSWWYHGPRLALQPVIIWWALFSGEVVDWPFHRSKA